MYSLHNQRNFEITNPPDHTVTIAAGTALSGALSVLPWATEPNVIMTHVGDLGDLNSLVEVKSSKY